MRGDSSLVGEISLWLAGEAGQVSLARTAEGAGWRAAVDQHAAEIRDALGEPMTAGCLMSYARGFTEAAVGRGWWPPHRRSPAPGLGSGLGSGVRAGDVLAGDVLAGDVLAGGADELASRELDWESLRLAAVCELYLQAQGLAPEV